MDSENASCFCGRVYDTTASTMCAIALSHPGERQLNRMSESCTTHVHSK
jgi:hypothetical protein